MLAILTYRDDYYIPQLNVRIYEGWWSDSNHENEGVFRVLLESNNMCFVNEEFEDEDIAIEYLKAILDDLGVDKILDPRKVREDKWIKRN